MIRQIFLTVFISSLIGSFVLTGLQSMQTIPLILKAEKFENNALMNYADHTKIEVISEPEEEDSWGPKNGMERLFYTFISNIFLALGFSFLLCTVYMYLSELKLINGIISGFIGYLIFFVLPSIGLSPEVPGTLAASLESRQTWWIMTVIASAIGFALLFFHKSNYYKALALVLILAPHIVGAPQAQYHAGTAPIEIFEAFVTATFTINGIFWLLLGAVSISLYKKFTPYYDSKIQGE